MNYTCNISIFTSIFGPKNSLHCGHWQQNAQANSFEDFYATHYILSLTLKVFSNKTISFIRKSYVYYLAHHFNTHVAAMVWVDLLDMAVYYTSGFEKINTVTNYAGHSVLIK